MWVGNIAQSKMNLLIQETPVHFLAFSILNVGYVIIYVKFTRADFKL